MIVLVAGANGRLGGLLVALLLDRGHAVRGLVRRQDEAAALEDIGATAQVGDLRGDVEWAADGCDAAIFAAGARHRPDLGAIDGGGAAKLAEAADRYGLRRYVLCSAVGAGAPERRDGPLREFLAAKHSAERRLERLDLPWTILRFGRLTDTAGTGRITTTVPPGTPVTLSRDDAALAVAEALERANLARPRRRGARRGRAAGGRPPDPPRRPRNQRRPPRARRAGRRRAGPPVPRAL